MLRADLGEASEHFGYDAHHGQHFRLERLDSLLSLVHFATPLLICTVTRMGAKFAVVPTKAGTHDHRTW